MQAGEGDDACGIMVGIDACNIMVGIDACGIMVGIERADAVARVDGDPAAQCLGICPQRQQQA